MRDRLSLLWETSYPYLVAILSGLMVRALPEKLPATLASGGINLSALYAALFNVNIFGAGVMISVFVFTQAPAAGFIAKLERLSLYQVFKRYLKEAVVVGLLAGVLCIPLSAASPQALMASVMPAMSVVAISLSVCFISLAYRVSRIFLFWTTTK